MGMADRREFLKGTAWMGAAAVAAGCMGQGAMKLGGGSMQGFACKPMKRIRVGFAGLGGRGTAALRRISGIPGCVVTAVCDLRQERLDDCNGYLAASGRAKAKEFLGPEAYRAMCDSDDVDVVYVCTGWQMHAPIGIAAVRAGKHAFVEVPCALTVDECWDFVESAEKSRVHAMILENCCYGEAELLCLNLCRMGKFGDLVHGEAAYIHDLRRMCYCDNPVIKQGAWDRGYYDFWRLRYNKDHGGNAYPTHGLGPVCQYMNVNRGDVMTELVSMDSRQANYEAYARDMFPADDWRAKLRVAMGDMNTTVVKTALGRTIMVQHDVSSPRPYSRINLISGTKGIFRGCYFADNSSKQEYCDPFKQGNGVRLAWERERGRHIPGYFDMKETEEIREKYRHPYFRDAGEIAKKVGGHGGMDFLMDLRWAYCLQNGLPLDMDVYDLASWSCLVELTERSAKERRYIDVPDFTRGGWKTAKPLGIVTVDVKKLGLGADGVRRDASQINI